MKERAAHPSSRQNSNNYFWVKLEDNQHPKPAFATNIIPAIILSFRRTLQK